MASSIWGLGGLSWTELAKRAWSEIQEDEVLGRAAQLAYYFLLALFPLLLFLISVIGYFAGEDGELRAGLFKYLSAVLPGDASKLVSTTITDVTQGSGGGKLSFGILAALWAASNGMGAISESLNVAYDVKETRPWWKTRLTAIGLTVALALLIISALVLVLYGHDIAETVASKFGLGEAFEWAWKILQWPLVLAFVLLAFSLLYFFGPDLHEQKWQWVTPGALIGVALWLLVSFGFRAYLSYSNTYSATYGSLGAVIILMLWFYFTGAAILIGGEINSEVEHAMAQAGDPEAKEKGERSPGDKEDGKVTGRNERTDAATTGEAKDDKRAREETPARANLSTADPGARVATPITRTTKAERRAARAQTPTVRGADRSLSFKKVVVVAGAWALSKVWRGGSSKKR